MTALKLLWYYLWIAPAVVQLLVVGVMVRRKLYQQFPIFFAYAAFAVCSFAVVFATYVSPLFSGDDYTHAYSIRLAVTTALRFGIIYEIFFHLVRNYPPVSRFARPIFGWTLVALLLAGVVLAAFVPGNAAEHYMYVIRVLDRTASILQCGLLLALFGFSEYLGLSWRNHLFGIALGLGIFASVELAVAAVRAQLGYVKSLDYVSMGTYHICALIWLVYVLKRERVASVAFTTLPAHDTEVWNQELQRLLRQ